MQTFIRGKAALEAELDKLNINGWSKGTTAFKCQTANGNEGTRRILNKKVGIYGRLSNRDFVKVDCIFFFMEPEYKA